LLPVHEQGRGLGHGFADQVADRIHQGTPLGRYIQIDKVDALLRNHRGLDSQNSAGADKLRDRIAGKVRGSDGKVRAYLDKSLVTVQIPLSVEGLPVL
jgi:hypothetical protein